jgi:hypothetical protein
MPAYRICLLSFLPTTMLLAACSAGPVPNLPVDPTDRIDLRAALAVDDAEVVGVTVDPVTGQRYVLDQFAGLFEMSEDGSATLLRSIAQLPVPTVLPRSLWTDFVAMGEGRFALTALSDGYLLDLEGNTMVEYFDDMPDDFPDEAPVVLDQLTHSVAFDADLGLLYAQPITFEEGGFDAPVAIASSVGSYSLEGGQPTAWFNLDELDFLAGGAAVDTDGTLILGRDNELHRFDPRGSVEPRVLGALADVSRIQGLAVDAQRNQLLVVDGDSDQLLSLPLDLGRGSTAGSRGR